MEIILRNKFQKIYKTKLYIKGENIILQLESDLGKYSRKMSLEELKEIDRYFEQSRNLEEALNDLKYLFEEKYSIDENEENINIIIHYRRNDIKFVLDKIKDEDNLLINSLSDRMKELIDKNELIIGIDLGTTYSSAAIMIDDNIVMIRNSLGSTTTPSYISFINKDEIYVGELAKLLPSNERNVIFNTKRLLGKKIDDPDIKEIQKKLPFNLKSDDKYNLLKIETKFEEDNEDENENDNIYIEEFYPEQICALILKKIVNDAEFYLSKKLLKNYKIIDNKDGNIINELEKNKEKKIEIKNAVITVPAYFNQKQREATLNAAKIIGLNVKTMINEPTAASLAYAYRSFKNDENKKIIVIDFGGGTLDITLLRYVKNKDGVYCDVKFTYGDTHFGGEDFDNILMTKCIEKYNQIRANNRNNQNNNFNIFNENHILRLKRACERAKIKLSTYEYTKIHIENDDYDSFEIPITRKDFIDYCKGKFEEFKRLLKDFIKKSKIDIKEIAEIILIGGTTLIPKVREIINDIFKYSIIHIDLDPKEVVAMGASIRAAKISNLPSVEDITLFDVTNLALGIREYGNIFNKIIERSTKIPYYNIGKFKTSLKNQTSASIEVYEGEEEKFCKENNLLLGKFKIANLPEKKKGEVKVEVKLEIQDNSILIVTAYQVDNQDNKEQLIIAKLNDFSDIMDNLIEREKKMYFFESKDYNEIKYQIIILEETIKQLKNNNNINNENIKSTYVKVLKIIGDFLIEYNKSSNLYMSFIKYYFNKICDFYTAYNIDDDEDLKKKIKDKIVKLIEKVYYYNKNLILEIIEESVDIAYIHKSFFETIMVGLWDEINTIFFSVKEVLKINDKERNIQGLENLEKANSIIEICLKLIDKFDENKIKINNITKGDLKVMKLKIEVREELIKNKDIFYCDSASLKQLYNRYYECPSLEPYDLRELGKLIGIGLNEDNFENLNEELERAEGFIKWLSIKNDEENNEELSHTIHNILCNYPFDKSYDKRKEIKNEFYKFKGGDISKDKYLMKLKSKYQKQLQSEQITDIERPVFNAILQYFNRLDID